MKFRSAFAVLLTTVALAACGNLPFQQEAAMAPEAPTHSGPPAVSPLEQPIETGAAATPLATAEASTMATAMFRAAGAGWTATAADKTAVYERAGAKSTGITVRRMSYAKGVEFVGNMNGSVFALNIRAQACEADGQRTPFTANLRVGSQRLTGCAAPTDTMPKAQVKASSAGPKPKAVAKPAAPKPATPKPAAEATPAATSVTAPAATETPAASPSSSTPATTTAPVVTTPAPSSLPEPTTVVPVAPTPIPAPAPTSTPAPAAEKVEPGVVLVPPADTATTPSQ